MQASFQDGINTIVAAVNSKAGTSLNEASSPEEIVNAIQQVYDTGYDTGKESVPAIAGKRITVSYSGKGTCSKNKTDPARAYGSAVYQINSDGTLSLISGGGGASGSNGDHIATNYVSVWGSASIN